MRQMLKDEVEKDTLSINLRCRPQAPYPTVTPSFRIPLLPLSYRQSHPSHRPLLLPDKFTADAAAASKRGGSRRAKKGVGGIE